MRQLLLQKVKIAKNLGMLNQLKMKDLVFNKGLQKANFHYYLWIPNRCDCRRKYKYIIMKTYCFTFMNSFSK